MSDYFDEAFGFTQEKEKGFVNNPNDSGGPTNGGITLSLLSTWRERPVGIEELKNLGALEKAAIFRSRYWRPLGLTFVASEPMAIAIFDAGVLFGANTSARTAQMALGTVDVDGHLGPKTLVALNASDAKAFIPEFISLFEKRVGQIVSSHPVDVEFRDGWLNRVRSYLKLIAA